MQVLSVDSAGVNLLSKEDGPAFAMRYNDMIAKKITGFENRFTAFNLLPMTVPEAAADELERTVKDQIIAGRFFVYNNFLPGHLIPK